MFNKHVRMMIETTIMLITKRDTLKSQILIKLILFWLRMLNKNNLTQI